MKDPKKEFSMRSMPLTSDDRLVEVMEKGENDADYVPATFSLSAIEIIKQLDANRSLLILHSGVKIKVALTYDVLKQKIYRPDFKKDDIDVLDLKDVTGKSAIPSIELVNVGDYMDDGSIYLGFHQGKDWFVTATDSAKLSFNQAAKHAQESMEHNHHDWSLPSKDILEIMYENRGVGKFKNSYKQIWYWASVPGMQKGFNDGRILPNEQDMQYARYVRSKPRPSI